MRKKTCSLYEEVVKRANVLAPAPASPRSCSCARAHHNHHVPEGQVPLPARLWRVVDDREDVDDRPQGARRGQLQLLEVPDGRVKPESDFDFEPINDKEYAEMCQKGELDAYCWWPLRDQDGPPRPPRRAKPHKQFAFPLMHSAGRCGGVRWWDVGGRGARHACWDFLQREIRSIM